MAHIFIHSVCRWCQIIFAACELSLAVPVPVPVPDRQVSFHRPNGCAILHTVDGSWWSSVGVRVYASGTEPRPYKSDCCIRWISCLFRRRKQSRNNCNNDVFQEHWRPDSRWVTLFVASTLRDTIFKLSLFPPSSSTSSPSVHHHHLLLLLSSSSYHSPLESLLLLLSCAVHGQWSFLSCDFICCLLAQAHRRSLFQIFAELLLLASLLTQPT